MMLESERMFMLANVAATCAFSALCRGDMVAFERCAKKHSEYHHKLKRTLAVERKMSRK